MVARKTDGELRLCGDYRPINIHVRQMPVQIPDIHASMQALVGYIILAELDLTTAFHQLPLDKESQQKLAISTPCGVYMPQFLPEGKSIGASALIQFMHSTFGDMAFVTPIYDNIMVAAMIEAELLTRVKPVLQRCRDAGTQLKSPSLDLACKSFFFRSRDRTRQVQNQGDKS